MHKHRLLLALDFEAAINLKQWDDIPNIIERASNILDDHLCSVFLDCTLRSGASAPNIAQVVKVLPHQPSEKPRRVSSRSDKSKGYNLHLPLLAVSILRRWGLPPETPQVSTVPVSNSPRGERVLAGRVSPPASYRASS
jgi:hypothetical protein